MDTDGSFGEFIYRIKNNKIIYSEKENVIDYFSWNKHYNVFYKDKFLIDGIEVKMKYDGYDSPYIKQTRKDKSRLFVCGSHSLYLDFYRNIRIEN